MVIMPSIDGPGADMPGGPDRMCGLGTPGEADIPGGLGTPGGPDTMPSMDDPGAGGGGPEIACTPGMP